jgi:CHAT domain-containing protein
MKSVATRYVMSDSGSRGHFNPGDLNRGGGFTYLDGTLREVEKIQKLLNDNKVNPLTITGNDATEESFKSLNNLKSPVFIHIATHGFFFPEPLKTGTNQPYLKKSAFDPFKNSENPLLRSGLIFAGANHAWKNQPLPANVEDGILLASEVAEMYLPNTMLVVLSACETGLGDIKGNEGVFGLQRAFRMAGVRYLINSLWQVPDYQTSELMTKFYEYWLSGLPIHDSFRNAQTFLKHKYSDNPFNWAAFVLLE